MGMDYRYAGSASYTRFDKELCAVARVFNGKLAEHLKKYEDRVNNDSVFYIFGFLSSEDNDSEKFSFPSDTNPLLVRWFNNPYGTYSKQETRKIWKELKKHPEIEDISPQIWDELGTLVECGDSWYIF